MNVLPPATAATLNGKDWTTLHPAIGPLGNVND
jgi:hypothetical protein